MTSSFFFLQAEKTAHNKQLLDSLEAWSAKTHTQVYIVSQPLGDDRYNYEYPGCAVILSPGRKICLVNFSADGDTFEEFSEDFIEDVGSISDKFEYKSAIGRPRKWKKDLVLEIEDGAELDVERYLVDSELNDPGKKRQTELIISLITGSINDIDRASADVPDNLLDKVKRKIQLFDADQTRFIYQEINKKVVHIQGLSGTGKTELLLHKLKDIYLKNPDSRIAMTCHNIILANSLRQRIPEFFNFMKVEQQIEWKKRLWCMHAWGSKSDPNSGTYRHICHHYNIPFYNFRQATFDSACLDAIERIKAIPDPKTCAFDYLMIDESQDFPESFIKLCELVTSRFCIVAGDIFQSIFDAKIKPSISPDFLLSKCYRTDPRALMFAHSLGMGLFEDKKLRWLEDDEWKTCGYIVEKTAGGSFYRLKREPLRRFEDVQAADSPAIKIGHQNAHTLRGISDMVIEAIREISKENPTITPDDIGIILVDGGNSIYKIQDFLAQEIPRHLGWPVNKAVDTKEKQAGTIFLSNRNNVKGLEFPFVVCVTSDINRNYKYRNSLYMTLTRSFIRSYLVVTSPQDDDMMSKIRQGLTIINTKGCIEAEAPSEQERKEIMTSIAQENVRTTFFDLCESVFDEFKVLPGYREGLRRIITEAVGETYDRGDVSEVVKFNYDKMLKKDRL